MNKQYGTFILSYARAKRQHTLKLLQKFNWPYPIRIVVSTDDPQLDQYRELYGERVITFDRNSVMCDYYDNMPPSGVLAARNIAWDLAESLGWTHFLVLDDDYSQFSKRLWRNSSASWAKCGPFAGFEIVNATFDVARLCNAMWHWLDICPQLLCVSFTQTGDLCYYLKRKVMQAFFLRTDRRFEFISRMNDDVTTYFDLGLRGGIVLQIPIFGIRQQPTQSQPGGLTDLYRQYGTYTKSLYTLLRWPAHAVVTRIPSVGRIHHRILPDVYPKIVKIL